MGWCEVAAFAVWKRKKREMKTVGDSGGRRAHSHAVAHANAPGEEDAFHDVEVLHQHIPLRLGAEVADGVTDAQLDGPLQSRGGGLEVENRGESEVVERGRGVVCACVRL